MDVLRCNRCNVKFESRDLLAMHMLDHSFSPEEDNATSDGNSDERSKLVTAELLDFRKRGLMASMTSSLQHLMSANMQDLIAGYTNSESKCEICLKVFADRDTLAMHTLTHAHEQKTYQKPGRAESFSCVYCGMVFSYEDMLLLHIVSRHKQLNGKLPLDLSVKTSVAQKRSYDSISQCLPTHSDLLRARRSYETTPLVTNPPHPSTVLAAAMMSLKSNKHASGSGNTSEGSQSPKQARISSISSSPTINQQHKIQQCKAEPLTPQTSDSEEKETRACSISPLESLSTFTMTRTNYVTPVNTAVDKTFPNSAYHKQASKAHYKPMVSATHDRSTPTSISEGQVSRQTPNRICNKSDSGGAMNPIQALQRALGESKEMFYFCIHCNIIFLDRAMYHLHTGLHNCNSPFQCNICGKEHSNALEFSAHIIHT